MATPFPLRIRSLTLRVRDLNTQRAFYQELLGLTVREATVDRMVLTPEGGAFTLELVADPSAPVRPWPSIGLYHFITARSYQAGRGSRTVTGAGRLLRRSGRSC